MNTLPVTDQPGYAANLGVLAALTAGALAAGAVWNSGWSAMSLVMPAVACIGPAGIALMHMRSSVGAGTMMTVAMIFALPAGLFPVVMA